MASRSSLLFHIAMAQMLLMAVLLSPVAMGLIDRRSVPFLLLAANAVSVLGGIVASIYLLSAATIVAGVGRRPDRTDDELRRLCIQRLILAAILIVSVALLRTMAAD